MSHNEKGNILTSTGIHSSDLQLPTQKDDLVSENVYLRDQIKVYICETDSLRQQLQTAEEKLEGLQQTLEENTHNSTDKNSTILPSFISQSHSINTKLVELSKNYRDKCCEVAKYKTKFSKLLSHFEEYKRKEENRKEENETIEENTDTKDNSELFKQIKIIQEKLNTTTNKMLDTRNDNVRLKKELRHMKRMFHLEVGEDFDSVQGNPTWKGRAQIIVDLQEKNKQLKEKLKNVIDPNSSTSLTETTRNIKTNRIHVLEQEIAELVSKQEADQKKIVTLKSRCKMLQTELQDVKDKYQKANDQNVDNFEVIASMSKIITENEQVKHNAIKEKDHEINKLKNEIEQLKLQLEKYKVVIEKMKNEQDNSEEMQSSSENNFKKELEIELRKLTNFIEVYKRRLDSERSQHEKSEKLLRLEKQKTVKLEALIATSDLDNSSLLSSRSRYSTYSQSCQSVDVARKNKLEIAEETIRTLQNRLNIEKNERERDYQEFLKILEIPSSEREKMKQP